MYTPHVKYSDAELFKAQIADLKSDIRQAREQAANGPYYPEKDITAESLEQYAKDCEREISELQKRKD